MAGKVFWGTNGAVEAYVETFAMLAEKRFGGSDPFAIAFRDERELFLYSYGRIVYLDKWLTTTYDRDRFLGLLDETTEEVLRHDGFTEYGRDWVTTVGELRVWIGQEHQLGESL